MSSVFSTIAARISAFPTTATGDKTAMMIEVQKLKANRKESHSCPLSSELQAKYGLSGGVHAVKFAMDLGGFPLKLWTGIQFA